MLVALMLAVTGFGVAYYFVNIYSIDLSWLNVSDARWGLDSTRFFNEMYPLVAGVVLIALFAYFTIASAVRRYKFYLSSGQDYRKMISLADSIDDLTNPAQIAKLSDFPELQSILRNYGDQIKEISQQMDESQQEVRSVDLEMEIDSILEGNDLQEALIEGKWWAPLARKIESRINGINENSGNLKERVEAARRLTGKVALSFGKVLESLAGSNDDILEIVRAVGSLNSIATDIGRGIPSASAPLGGTDGQPQGGALDSIKVSLQRLNANSRVLHDFSEENNGLALNMALMAAKGEFADHDLAQFAEKVRSTAEKFNKLGTEMAEMSGNISQNLQFISGSVQPANVDHSSVVEDIKNIAVRIEQKSHSLQEKITSLGNELESLNGEIHMMLTEDNSDGEMDSLIIEKKDSSEEASGSDGNLVTFGADFNNRESDDGGLVLDRSDEWQATSALKEEPAEDLTVDFNEKTVEPPQEGMSLDLGGMPEARREEVQEVETGEAEMAGPHEGEDWMEMPGHKWVKIESEGKTQEPDDLFEEVSETPSERSVDPVMEEIREPGMIIDELAQAIAGSRDCSEVAEHLEESTDLAAEPEMEDGEKVHDLYDLGAVEYAGDTPNQQ